jgi:hypothetical protein
MKEQPMSDEKMVGRSSRSTRFGSAIRCFSREQLRGGGVLREPASVRAASPPVDQSADS